MISKISRQRVFEQTVDCREFTYTCMAYKNTASMKSLNDFSAKFGAAALDTKFLNGQGLILF